MIGAEAVALKPYGDKVQPESDLTISYYELDILIEQEFHAI
jgi:hypothetical protein